MLLPCHPCAQTNTQLLRHPLPDGGLAALDNTTPYSIMFGPDRCGATDKVHLILQHQSPITHEWSEHHVGGPPRIVNDQRHHVYTMALRHGSGGGDGGSDGEGDGDGSGGTYEIWIDGESKATGSLSANLEPPINVSGAVASTVATERQLSRM